MVDFKRKPEIVWTMPQVLSDAEQLQARQNMGAAALVSLAPAFSTSKAYKQGERVTYDGKVYVFKSAHPAGAWMGTDVIEDTFAFSCGGVTSCGTKTDSDVVGGVLTLDLNNSLYALTTSLSTLIVEITMDAQKPAVPNFALQVVNSADLTMYVRLRITNTGGADILSYMNVADAAGNVLDACAAGEGNQVTCVGGCWTQAKFVAAEPST